MKLRLRLLVMALLPVIALGVLTYLGASSQIRINIEEQTYTGMLATTLAVRDVLDSSVEGEYHLDEKGQMWKGDGLNISETPSLVDSIKKETGFDVTIFYGNERVLTSIKDESGNRVGGTQPLAEINDLVLGKGQNFSDNDIEISGKRFMCFYIPLFQENTSTPIGMIFMGKDYKELIEGVGKTQSFMLVMMLIILTIVSITSAISANRIAAAIKGGIHYLEQMCDGKLGNQASEKLLKRGDEIGDMCRGIKKLDENLTAIVSEIQHQTRILGKTSESCSSNAHEALESTEQVDAAAQEVASATTTQAQGAQEAENSVEHIGRIIEDTNERMREFSNTSAKMAEASGSVKKTLAELNQSMNQVKSAVEHVHQKTNETHVSVEKIGEMTNVITAIATQTNLLSLNASIEAARAGEMGKGFAVVAEEIRKLAEECNTSAVEIQEVLAQLKSNSDVSVSTMEEVQKNILVQADKLNQTNQAFLTVENGIDQSVKGIGEIINEIDILNNEKSNAVTEVKNVAALAQENAASIEETAAAIDNVSHLISSMAEGIDGLSQVSEALDEKAAVFRITQNGQ